MASTDQWKSAGSMSTGRREFAGICVNDHQFLVIGGRNYKHTLSSCEYYDSKTNTWNTLPPELDMPCGGRSDFGVAMINNRVYVIGGHGVHHDEYYTRSDVVSIDIPGGDLSSLTATNASWNNTKWKPMSRGLWSFACVSHDKYIYVFGGRASYTDTRADAARFDTESNSWESLPSMPIPCYGCEAGVVKNKIFIVGGVTGDGAAVTSTPVFDVSKHDLNEDSWDVSTFPAMNNVGMSVTVVGSLLLSIGGFNDELLEIESVDTQAVQNVLEIMNTIEILDTQTLQNAQWKAAKTTMTNHREYLVSGLLKSRNEIIVAGGYDYASGTFVSDTEVVDFVDGILPDSLKLGTRGREILDEIDPRGDRGQEIRGDTDKGPDELGVKIIAKALAEMLVFQDLTPPFVLGILGRWGWGKSYFFNLILDEVIRIQKMPSTDYRVREVFAGHIYVVRFSAWTFAKGDIMSSMMYKILKDLDEQLQLEEKLSKIKKEYITEGLVSTIELWRDISTGEKEFLKEVDSFTLQKILKNMEDIKDNGDNASECLLSAITVNYKNDKKRSDRIKQQIKYTETVLKKEKEEEIENERTKKIRKNIKKIEKYITVSGKQLLDKKLEELEASDDWKEDVIKINGIVEEFKRFKFIYFFRFKDILEIPPRTKIFVGIFLIADVVLLVAYLRYSGEIAVFLSRGGAIICTVVAFATPYMSCISSAYQKAAPHFKNIQEALTKVVNEETSSFDCSSNPRLIELQKQLLSIKKRTVVLEGHSLHDVIVKKIDSEKYENRLGIAHNVQQDLQSISDGMLNKKQKMLGQFPRGDPRILLFVDDLDRCEHSIVVEVVEALQLVVKEKLFVAILAIDPRYVTLSIEKKYKDILNHKDAPSGMDFLEKIIQIPFRLPGLGVGERSVDDYLSNQVEIEVEIETPQETILNGENTPSDADDSKEDRSKSSVLSSPRPKPESELDLGGDSIPRDVDESEDSIPRDADKSEDDLLPSNKILCTVDEKKMLLELFKLFMVSPRCLKRIINVFKLLKVIWKRDNGNQFDSDNKTKKATVFLMLMAADESTREATNTIFGWMESGMVKYHRVTWDPKNGDEDKNNLANLFKRELKKTDKHFNSAFKDSNENVASKKGTLLAAVENYLIDQEWSDVDGWKKISSRFLLARSFSFFTLHAKPSTDDEAQD